VHRGERAVVVGAPGFTASDTRVLKDASTGREVRRETRNVRYNPQPKIVCGGTE
jgi:hypothetical protein